MVEAEDLLIQIVVKVEWFDGDVCAAKIAPHGFQKFSKLLV